MLRRGKGGITSQLSFPTNFYPQLRGNNCRFIRVGRFFMRNLYFRIFFARDSNFVFPCGFAVLLVTSGFRGSKARFIANRVTKKRFRQYLYVTFRRRKTFPFRCFKRVAPNAWLRLVLRVFCFSCFFCRCRLVLCLIRMVSSVLLNAGRAID